MGARLEFGILGPLEVRNGAVRVPVGGPRQRALLSLLLCNANRVVSRDRLLDELLGGQPADSAERLLRVQVSRLRKALAVDGDGPRLIARPPGYLLRVEECELDLHEFERLLSAGREALQRGDPERASRILREAESLWRGRPLADLEFEPFARLEVERLEELRLGAVEERIEAELAVGRHTAACAELETLVEEHPLRERLRGQLILALYRSGRQADALEVYRAGRSLLVDELGLEPGPELQALERAILTHDPALQLERAIPGRNPGLQPERAIVTHDPTPQLEGAIVIHDPALKLERAIPAHDPALEPSAPLPPAPSGPVAASSRSVSRLPSWWRPGSSSCWYRVGPRASVSRGTRSAQSRRAAVR